MYIWQRPAWPAFTWDNEKVLKTVAEVRYEQGRFMGFISSLSSRYLKEAQELIFAEDSKALAMDEGLYIKSDAGKNALIRHLGLPTDIGHLGAQSKIVRHEVEISEIYNWEEPLTIERLLAWHKLVLGDVKEAGELRGKKQLKITSALKSRTLEHFLAPPRAELEVELQCLIDWVNLEAQDLDPFIAAAIAMLWFLTLWPFSSGNEYVARLLANMILMHREGNYLRFFLTSSSMLGEHNANKESYLRVLERSQKGNLNVTQWIIWYGQMFKKICHESLETMMPVFHKASFWLSYDNSSFTTRQMDLINDMIMQPEKYKEGISKGEFTEITGMSGPSAYRELKDLVDKGCMVEIGGPKRGRRYALKALTADQFRC